MGTPDFAVPILAALAHHAGHPPWQLVAVATQPDRPSGRGKQLAAGPVKQAAGALAVPILQPVSLRKSPDAVEELRRLAPDIIVVAAYGLILPASVLAIPRFGCINVHASVLPAYRGASPIAAAILDGLTKTGVSIMLMDEGMDTGPVLAQDRLTIAADDTTESLSHRLSELGATLLLSVLTQWVEGHVAPVPQSELPGEPSSVRLIRKEDGLIDWTQPAARIERMTRAYAPWPGAFTFWRGEPFRIHRAHVLPGSAPPGLVVKQADGIGVGSGDQILMLDTVQPAGKKPMLAADFVNGAPNLIGATFGGPPDPG
jgi:methionyl-tRNA formyltransferase